MGKFDRYGSGVPALPDGNHSSLLATRVASEIDRINATARARVAAPTTGALVGSLRVAIALDATGSMGALLDAAKDAIIEIARRATRETGVAIEIELIAFRDYDALDLLLERSGPSVDPERLKRWLANIKALGGGADGGEAIEAALKCVVKDEFAVVILAGDEPSHTQSALEKAGRPETLTALRHAEALGRRHVPVHSFVIGNDARTIADFAAISQASGGKSGRLDGSAEMLDLAVMAILAAVKGAAGVRRYVATTPKLSNNAQAFGQLLLASK